MVMSGDTAYTPYGSDGEELSGDAGAAAMEAGYLATLKRIHRAGLRTVVIQGHPGLGQRRPGLRLRRPPAPRFLRLRPRPRQDQGIRRPRRDAPRPEAT